MHVNADEFDDTKIMAPEQRLLNVILKCTVIRFVILLFVLKQVKKLHHRWRKERQAD